MNYSRKISNKPNGFAIAGFVCSLFIPLLGFVFGGIGLSKSKELNEKGRNLSIAALVISGIDVLINIISILSILAG